MSEYSMMDAQLAVCEVAMMVTIVTSDVLDDFSLFVKTWIFVVLFSTFGCASWLVHSMTGYGKIWVLVFGAEVLMVTKAFVVMWAGIFGENDRFKAEVMMWSMLFVRRKELFNLGA